MQFLWLTELEICRIYDKCLINLKRMLKPGGVISFHEYSLNDNFFAKLYWKILGYSVIIPISTLLSGSSKIYKYLVKSVITFPSPNKFVEILNNQMVLQKLKDYQCQVGANQFYIHF